MVTAFPERWDSQNKDNFSQQTLQSLVKPNTIKGAAVDPKTFVHRIVKRSMEYEPSVKFRKETLPYLEVFSREVLRVVGYYPPKGNPEFNIVES